MSFQGRVFITDEAIETFKKVNLGPAWTVQASWDKENVLLQVNCQPPGLSFSWSWREINELLGFGEEVVPSNASVVRTRELITLDFSSDKETKLCKPLLSNGDVYEVGILTSKGFILCEETNKE